jgi:hypothetical protein
MVCGAQGTGAYFAGHSRAGAAVHRETSCSRGAALAHRSFRRLGAPLEGLQVAGTLLVAPAADQGALVADCRPRHLHG